MTHRVSIANGLKGECTSLTDSKTGLWVIDEFPVQHFVTAEGLTIVGNVAGNPEASSVILLHGGGQTRHSWSGAMRQLVTDGYHVINYDARGHGDSDWAEDGDYSHPAHSRDLMAVLETVSGPVALVGASMGGMTSFYTVGKERPTNVQALVMVDITLRTARSGSEKIKRFMSANQDGFASLDEAAEAVAAYNPQRPRPSDPSGLMKNLRRRDDGRFYWHWDPRMLSTSPRSEPPEANALLETVAPDVTIPTLLVRGSLSDIVDNEGVAAMRAAVPQTEIYEVAGAGHMVAGDRNDAFNLGVMGFLRSKMPASNRQQENPA